MKQKKVRFPWKPLQSGQFLGIIAPSAPCEEGRFQLGLAELRRRGVDFKVALEPFREYGSNKFLFSSDSPTARAGALEQLFEDPSVGAILCARGAYGSMEILPLIDWKRLGGNSKPLVGFSDSTALLLAMLSAGVGHPIHGPSLESAFTKAQTSAEASESARDVLDMLGGECDLSWGQANLQLVNNASSFGSAGSVEAVGEIVGGNLSVLCSLLGTPWFPDLNGKILFLEEVGERPYRIHRMLLQLALSGKLRGVSAVLLGDFIDCQHPKKLGPDFATCLSDIFNNLHLPVFGFFESGHGLRNRPLPFGVNVRLDKNGLKLE